MLLVLFILLVVCQREPRFLDQGVGEKEDLRHMTREKGHAMPAGNVEEGDQMKEATPRHTRSVPFHQKGDNQDLEGSSGRLQSMCVHSILVRAVSPRPGLIQSYFAAAQASWVAAQC